jgi:hypothetical protein
MRGGKGKERKGKERVEGTTWHACMDAQFLQLQVRILSLSITARAESAMFCWVDLREGL